MSPKGVRAALQPDWVIPIIRVTFFRVQVVDPNLDLKLQQKIDIF